MPAPSSLGRLRDRLAALGGGLAALAYPTLCLGCEARLPSAADALCPTCLGGLPRADADAAGALVEGTAVAGLVAVWAFDAGGTVRRVQHALKYGGRPALGVGLGRAIGAAVREAGVPCDAVVPVPLSHLRELERGYNQAAALADGAARALGVPTLDLLRRTRATRRQATLSASARRANVDGAFALADGAGDLSGTRLLLVDDVTTTGTTLAAAAAPLATAGAHVEAAVIALAGA